MTISVQDLRQRPFPPALAFTAAALLVHQIGAHLPLPMLDLSRAGGQWLSGTQQVSILALGTVPWLSALLLFELASLMFPVRLTSWFTRGGHADPFSLAVVGSSLLLAALQGYGVTEAMAHVPGLLLTTTAKVKFANVVTLVGGVALLIATARLIDLRGLGSGFWTLLALAFAPQFIQGLLNNLVLMREGIGNWRTLGLAVGIAFAIAGATVAILEARNRAGLPSAAPLPLAFLLSGTLLTLPMMVAPDLIAAVVSHDFGFLALNGLKALFAIGVMAIYARREKSWPLLTFTGALFFLLSFADALSEVALHGRAALLSSWQIMVVVVVAHTIYRSWLVPRAP